MLWGGAVRIPKLIDNAMKWTRRLLPRFGLRTMFVIVTGLAVYIAAYFALLNPVIVVKSFHLGIVIEGSREPYYGEPIEGEPADRLFNHSCRFIFAPVEWIDYRLRPGYWDHYSDLPQK